MAPARLPSLGAVALHARGVAGRFPAVLASGLVAALAAILAFDELGPAGVRGPLVAAASLGLPLFTALTLFGEQRVKDPLARAGLLGLGVAVLAAFYVAWGGWYEEVRAMRYIQASLTFHLLVAFLPFWGRPEGAGFWQFNRILFERFLQAAVYAGVLWGGLALALAALDQLFGVSVPDAGYGRLWVVAAFVFNPWFFLAGVPRDLDALETPQRYPAVLRGFVQYALIPLVAIYLLILTAYFAKVLVTWDWPSGWIGWLVSGVAVAGIFALLLIHPVADAEEGWARRFARGFWVALLPAVVMLWLALGQRIAQYGITERRYFLLVLSVWLAAIAVYYAVTRARGIRQIPLTLAAVALITFAGPWGGYAVARVSQQARLETLLQTAGVLAGGTVRAAPAPVDAATRREIGAVLQYLMRTHGPDAVRSVLGDSLADAAGVAGRLDGYTVARNRVQRVMAQLELPFVSPGTTPGGATWFSYFAGRGDLAVDVRGYDYLFRVTENAQPRDGVWGRLAATGDALELLDGETVLLTVPLMGAVAAADAFRLRQPRGNIPAGLFQLAVDGPRARALVLLSSVRGRDSLDTRRVTDVTADVLLDVK